LASDLKAFSANQHSCTLLQYVDDLLLDGLTWEECMEGTHFFLFYERQDTKSPGKKLRFSKALSNTMAFTCSRDSAGLALRGNKLFVLFQPLRTAGKSGSFWELQVSAKSGSLTTPSWPNPSTRTQSEGEWEPLIKGEEQEKVFRGIEGAHKCSCSRPARCDEALFLVCP
jgi:hypothetical protein